MQHVLFSRAPLGALVFCSLGASVVSLPAHAAPMMKPQSAQTALGNLPMRAMRAIKSNDLATLARLAHSSGVRFSPGAFVEKTDLTFSPAQIRRLKKRGAMLWGTRDGSGDPIRLTWAGYRREFLWTRDFSRGKLAFNTFTHRGNRMNNLREAYADAIFVESYLPGTEKYGGMDWNSLWMVWKKEGGKWKLRGVANDYWTT
jgi:hypothetical protein